MKSYCSAVIGTSPGIETKAEYTKTEHSFSLLYDNEKESIDFNDDKDHSSSWSETGTCYISSNEDDDSLTLLDDQECEHEM